MALPTDKKKIAFRTWHGKWACVEPTGLAIADRDGVQSWEEFEIHSLDNHQVAIRSRAHDRYLCAEHDGRVICNRTQIGSWERWTPYRKGDRTGFLSYHRGMLGALPNGHLHAAAPHFLAWESFEVMIVVTVPEGQTVPGALFFGHWGRFVRGMLKSDPIGQDPGESPNFVGNEGWQVADAFAEQLRQRYKTRYENNSGGPELEPSERGMRRDLFEKMDRGNYDAEKFSRDSRTA